MSFSRTLGAMTILLLAIGCREMVQPNPDFRAPRIVAVGRALGPTGEPLVAAQIVVTNERLEGSREGTRHVGTTDSSGIFVVEVLHLGPFDVWVDPVDSSLPTHTFINQMFSNAAPVELRYSHRKLMGRVVLPAEFDAPIDDFEVDTRYFEDGFSHTTSIDLETDGDGTFEIWLEEKEYDFACNIAAGDLRINYSPQLLLVIDPDTESFEFEIPLAPVTIDWNLAGDRPLSRISVGIRTSGTGNTTLDVTTDQPIQHWSFEGISEITVSTIEDLFFPVEYYFNAGIDSEVSIDLATNRLIVHLVDTQGVPIVEDRVRLRHSRGWSNFALSDLDGEILFYVDPGAYILDTDSRSGQWANSQVVEVTDEDVVVEVVLDY